MNAPEDVIKDAEKLDYNSPIVEAALKKPALGIETLKTLASGLTRYRVKIEPSRSWKARAPSRI